MTLAVEQIGQYHKDILNYCLENLQVQIFPGIESKQSGVSVITEKRLR